MKIEHKDFAFEIKDVSDKGLFTGYGSVFGEMDYGGDIVAAGAFTRTLEEAKAKGRKFPVLWQHKSSEAIGIYENIFEDDRGLFVEGRLLIDEVQKAKEAYALLRAGAVTGLSIGYSVNKYEMDTENYIRTLTEIELYEVSQVTFPMLDSARIDAVKNRIREGVLPTKKEFEDFLRESGFSKSHAVTIASQGLGKLLRSESVTDTQAIIAEALKGFQLPTILSKENSNVR